MYRSASLDRLHGDRDGVDDGESRRQRSVNHQRFHGADDHGNPPRVITESPHL